MIPRFAVRHPVTVTMLFLAGALLGGIALTELPVDLLPELQAPRVAVQLRSGDRPPEELEDRYARPLETVLATLPGVTSVRTISSTGRVLATVEFEWDTDMDFALLDVQKQVAPLLGDRDVDSLVVRRFDPSAEPVVVVGLSPVVQEGREVDLDALRRLAEDRVGRTLERLEGVASVEVAGGRTREVRVTVERHRLAAQRLTIDRLVSLIAQANAEASGGTVEDRGRVHVIKGLGQFRRLADVADLPLPGTTGADPSEGGRPTRPLRLSDVADVRWADAPVRGQVLVNGREGVSLSIFKEAGENTVAVSDRVHEALGGLRAATTGVDVLIVRDQAGFIRQAVRDVELAALVGSLLAVIVLFLFLRNVVAVLLVSLAIPLSVVVTFALLDLAGLTLNLMTLGGLALGVGMLIDNAIVVLEAIFRHREDGADAATAAERGATEVGGAILAATLTTCVVFLPVVFLRGVAAELFTDLAFTVVFALLCSLAVAMLLLPAAAARLLRREDRRAPAGLRRGVRYQSALRAALARPATVVSLAVLLVATAVTVTPRLGLDFLPSSDPGELNAHLMLPEGTRVTVTREAAVGLEAALRRAFPGEIEATVAELGEAVRDETSISEQIPSENQGVLRVRLVPRGQRAVTTEQVARLLERAGAQVEGLALRLEPADAVLGQLAQRGPPIRLEVRGQELAALEEATARVAEALRRDPSVFDVHSSFEERRAEVRLDLDRTLMAGLGLTPDEVARQLRQRLGAEPATTFRSEGEDRDVVVTTTRRTLRSLPALTLDTRSSEPVRLGDLATVRIVTSPTRVERSLNARLGVVTAQLAPGATLGGASASVEESLRRLDMPPGVHASLGGAEAERRASFSELSFAIGLAIILVYMVMASLFESIVHPFTILFTLPTAGVGVVLALAATSTPFSVPALLGVVMLAGIAVNNGILLVDLTGRLRASGLDRREAIARAARTRLRPILMTSLTTVLAMLPLAVGWGEGSDLRAPMAIAVVGGLTASTVLTLFLVPVAYDLLDRLRPSSRTSPAPRAAAAPAEVAG